MRGAECCESRSGNITYRHDVGSAHDYAPRFRLVCEAGNLKDIALEFSAFVATSSSVAFESLDNTALPERKFTAATVCGS